MRFFLLTAALMGIIPALASARPICTVVVDASTRETVYEEGDCHTRVTPASTFKIALAVMGFDAGILQDAQTPGYPFREGYVDWGGNDWRQTATPSRWMEYSVVWYTRLITPQLGEPLITDYLEAFGYGNADFSGDAFQSNGLERAWMTSSLLISPREQTDFLVLLLSGELPVSRSAVENTVAIMPQSQTAGGWRIWGKSGTAYPRDDTGRFDYSSGWGWYVGWAERDGQRVVFAHLLQDETRQPTSPGRRAPEVIVSGLDAFTGQLGQ